MANLSLRHIYKVYPNGVKAVNDFNMEIKDNEFIVFVGPSGCGKSTTLRMIAGLEEISAGELFIGEDLVNDVEPKDRDISMVFQNYALYPHMSVYDNMAFGLRLRHLSTEEIHNKVMWAAKALRLTEYLDRKPRAMSGGQRQRVALGRAILRNPKVFLLDEPLSNLDAKLRTEMRSEIAKLHNTLKTTFIYVTHDQVEAMTLGTRVVVMKNGFIQQVNSPQNLYNYPDNKFVAGFIGTPQMNFFKATLSLEGNNVNVAISGTDENITISANELIKINPSYYSCNKEVWVGIRCENIVIGKNKKAENTIKVKISHFEELGSETLVYASLNLNSEEEDLSANNQIIIKSYQGALGLKPEEIIDITLDVEKMHFFDIDTEKNIVPRIPTDNFFVCDIKNNTLSFLNQTIKLPQALQVEDVEKGQLYIPTNAITFDGTFEAEVEKVEEIDETKVIHLKVGDRVFFALNQEAVEGQKVKINIDLKQIKVLKDEECIITPLEKYNTFYGGFTNYENNDFSINNTIKTLEADNKKKIAALTLKKDIKLGELGMNDALEKQARADYKEALLNAQMQLENQFANSELTKEGRKKIKAEHKERLNLVHQEYQKRLDEIKVIKKKSKTMADTAEKANQIVEEYNQEVAKLNEILQVQKSALIDSKAPFKKMASEDIKESNKELAMKQQELLAQIKEEEQSLHESNDYKNANDKDKAKMDVEFNKKAEDRKAELISASKVFYISINGKYVKSTYLINKKVIQALGVALFKTSYRFEIANNCIIPSEDGITVKITKVLDYGNKDTYVIGEYCNQQYLIKVDTLPEIGTELNVSFNLDDIKIFENKFDVRLY